MYMTHLCIRHYSWPQGYMWHVSSFYVYSFLSYRENGRTDRQTDIQDDPINHSCGILNKMGKKKSEAESRQRFFQAPWLFLLRSTLESNMQKGRESLFFFLLLLELERETDMDIPTFSFEPQPLNLKLTHSFSVQTVNQIWLRFQAWLLWLRRTHIWYERTQTDKLGHRPGTPVPIAHLPSSHNFFYNSLAKCLYLAERFF